MQLQMGPKRKIILFPEMQREKSSPGRPQKIFLINLIEFFTESLHLKELIRQHSSLLKNKESNLLLFREKKRQFVRIDLLVENRPNGEFY